MIQGDSLKGMRVVEVSAFVAAPSGGMALAQLGAEVIRIDGLKGGLDYRRWPVTENNDSLFWVGLNRGKRSVAIDIGRPEGREIAQALITAPGNDAGILLTNLPPRGWLDYDSLRQQRTDLIQLTVQGDHQGGSAVDYTLNPRLGLPFLTGPGDPRQAVNHVLPAWDLITGQMAALGLLAAERQRSRQGIGQHVKLALEDVGLAAMAQLGFLAEAQLGIDRGRIGNDLYGAFGRDFATADGERVMIVGLTLKQWRGLCEACGITQQVAALGAQLGVNLDREGARFEQREALSQLVAPWVAARSLAQVRASFDQHGVCWGRYQSVQQLLTEDPACSTSNPMFSQVEQPGIGTLLSPATPLRFDERRRPAAAAPRLGSHTEQVLAEVLGLSDIEIARLHDQQLVLCA